MKKNPLTKKILLIMRLTFLLLFACFINISASIYSQKFTFEKKSVTIKDILAEIETTSNYKFLYRNDLVDVTREVDLNVRESDIDGVLSKIFDPKENSFKVFEDNLVVITSKNIIQEHRISGTVTDSKGEPLPGVNVVITGTNQGTTTDISGNYSIDVSPEAMSLTFTYIGMETQEITIGTMIQINVTMVEAAIGLQEVVVIGYGTKSKQTLTGAVSLIEDEVLQSRPSAVTTDLLQGISSGIQITRNNTGDIRSSMNGITIRGITSRSAPGVLVVVDGVTQPFTDARALDNINPNDIESISILKDGQAAIYGARAAGGVILVTTKAGRSDKPVINVSATATIQKPSLMRKTLNVLDLYEMQNEGYINDGILSNGFTPVLEYIADNHITLAEVKENNGKHIFTEPWGVPYALGHYEWNDIMFDPSLQQNYNISVSGRKDKLNYYESVNYINQDGMLAYGKNYKKRLLVTLKNDYDINNFLKIRSNFNIGNQKVVEPYGYSINTYNTGVQGALFFVMPTNQPYTKGGRYFSSGFGDPIGYAEATGYTTDILYTINGKLGAEITPFKDLLITAEIASNYNINDIDYAKIGFPTYDLYDNFAMMSTDDPNNGPATAGSELRRTRYTVGNLFAKYSFEKLENHKINLMAGYSHEENDYRGFSAYRQYGLINAQLPTMSAGNADEQYNSETKNDYALNSVYSRLEYGFKNRYLFEGIFRYDGSSKFAEGYKWAPFFGFSGAWIISDESFMSNLKTAIDFLKVRASWGQLGNQSGIDLYDYLSQVYIGGAYPMGPWNSPYQVQYATLGGMASTTRTWETIESINMGIDFMTLSSRLTGSFDYYIKNNRNMFFAQEFPSVLGTEPPSINGAHVRTKGWEMELNWKDKISRLNYFIRLNLSDNKTKVIDLADRITPVQGTNDFIQGYPVYSYFGYEYDGFIQTESELSEYTSSFSSGIPNNLTLGDARYKDLDGDDKLEALVYEEDENGNPADLSGDLVQIGDGGQHYLYGVNLGVSWKNFDFSCFFQGAFKWQVISNVVPCSEFYEPIETYFYHQTWASDRTGVPWPRLSQDGSIKGYNYQYSNAPYKLVNNKYLRLKNIQLGYSLPDKLARRMNLERLRVYLSGTDIWELSNLPGNQDPETPFALRVSPFPRQYSFGIDLTF